MSPVTPLSKSLVKEFTSLKQKKYRQKYNKFVVEGEKMVSELMAAYPELISCIIIRNDFIETYRFVNKCPVYSITPGDISKISSLSSPPPVLAIAKLLQPNITDEMLAGKGLFFYLDDIKDPGNMGTIIRSFDWFGGQGLFISPDSVDIYNPKVVQATMGSLFGVPFMILPFEDVVKLFSIDQMAYLDMEGEDCRSAEFAKKMLFVIGSESRGVSPQISDYIRRSISIPAGNTTRHAESLNASVAASVIAYEYIKRKFT